MKLSESRRDIACLIGAAFICTTLAACGGGGSSGNTSGSTSGSSGSSSSTGSTGSTGTAGLTTGARSTAATATAQNNADCTSISPFYWEIGDATGTLASGTGGNGSVAAPTEDTIMSIASSSKWMFSTYVAEQRAGNLSASDINFLTFESGYTNFNSCSSTSTVSSCLTETGQSGGTNGDFEAGTQGSFYYNGGHMQELASTMSIGSDDNAALAAALQGTLGANVPISYSQPQLAGGIYTSAAVYAQFLRNMLAGSYSHMLPLLGSNAVCTHTNSSDCPNAIFSPVNQSIPGGPNDVSNESWHYSIGHWVEDDPTVGDGAFSSPGRFGFYPWIDSTKTWYGVLARYDPLDVMPLNPTQAAYYTSVQCGRLIRKAWLTGTEQ